MPSPNQVLQGPSIFANLYALYQETDGNQFRPAIGAGWMYADGTWTDTRVANGLYSKLKTAGAATTHPSFSFLQLLGKIGADPIGVGTPNLAGISGQAHQLRGIQVTAFDLLYTLGTANLTSLTPLIWRSVFANGVAVPTPTALGGVISATPAAAIVFGTNMKVVNYTLGTPFVVGNNAADTLDVLEVSVVDAGSSVFALYGINVYFNYCEL